MGTVSYWDIKENKGQGESPMNPDGVMGQPKWEINISKGGRHVFATDSTIRTYHAEQIRDIILLFHEKFPKEEGYVMAVTAFYHRSAAPIPDFVQAAIDGRKWK
jgi:hypothetical protein